jgi:hypothetical protein
MAQTNFTSFRELTMAISMYVVIPPPPIESYPNKIDRYGMWVLPVKYSMIRPAIFLL